VVNPEGRGEIQWLLKRAAKTKKRISEFRAFKNDSMLTIGHTTGHDRQKREK